MPGWRCWEAGPHSRAQRRSPVPRAPRRLGQQPQGWISYLVDLASRRAGSRRFSAIISAAAHAAPAGVSTRVSKTGQGLSVSAFRVLAGLDAHSPRPSSGRPRRRVVKAEGSPGEPGTRIRLRVGARDAAACAETVVSLVAGGVGTRPEDSSWRSREAPISRRAPGVWPRRKAFSYTAALERLRAGHAERTAQPGRRTDPARRPRCGCARRIYRSPANRQLPSQSLRRSRRAACFTTAHTSLVGVTRVGPGGHSHEHRDGWAAVPEAAAHADGAAAPRRAPQGRSLVSAA